MGGSDMKKIALLVFLARKSFNPKGKKGIKEQTRK